MLESVISLVESIEAEIDIVNMEVEHRTLPFQAAIDLLDEIPGLGRHSVEMILAEIGTDMSRFQDADHLASWARLCPGTNMSAGKRGNASIGPGSPWLRGALMEVSLGALRADRAKPNFLAARYRHIAARRGAKRAQVAVAHSVLVAIYHMLKNGAHYHDLGAQHWEQHHRDAIVTRSVRRLEKLGYRVTVEAGAA